MADFTSLLQGLSRRDIGYIIKGIIQKSVNQELTNSDISNNDNKTPVLITNSKDVALMNDMAIQAAVDVDPLTTQFYMPEEADGKDLKIWIKFQNAGELRDHSFKKNRSFSVGSTNMPGLFHRYVDDSQIKYEMFSYFNGLNQFAYAHDNAELRLTKMITDSKKLSVFMRILPVSLSKLVTAQFNVLYQKVDDDQLRYGYGATMDVKGNINVYIRNNYRQYNLFIKNPYNYILTDPIYNGGGNFRVENFSKKDFMTNYETLCNIVKSTIPFDDWIFTYNPTNHRIYTTFTNATNVAAVKADTDLISVKPIIDLPIQEGKWTHSGTVQTTLYDASINGYNATITDIALGGDWQQDNTLKSLGSNTGGTAGGMYATFPTIASINSATEFTITFWYKPITAINTKSYSTLLVEKNFGNSSFDIYRPSGTSDLRFRYTDSTGTIYTVTFTNAFPIVDKWYSITVRAKINEPLELLVDNVSVTGQTPTTLTTSGTLQLFDNAVADTGIMSLFKFYTTKISNTLRDDLFYQGYHNPLFPRSENIQQVWDDTPDPIPIPFTVDYLLDKPTGTLTSSMYEKINSLSSNAPFAQLYSVADGASTTDPIVIQYNVPEGVTTGGDLLPFTRIGAAPATIDSSDNSTTSLGDGQNQVVGLWIQPVAGTGIGDTIVNKTITKAIFWMRKQDATVAGTISCKIWDAAGVVKYTFTTTVSANTLTQTNGSASSYGPVEFTGTTNTFPMLDGYTIGVEYTGFASGQQIDIQRKGSWTDDSAFQMTRNSSGDWDDNGNPDFGIKCDLYTGGTGSATVSPWITLNKSTQLIVCEQFGTGSSLLNKAPTKIEFKVKKKTGTTGTLYLQIVGTNGAIKTNGTLKTWNIATDPNITDTDPAAGVLNLVWEDITNSVTVQSGERICLLTPASGTGTMNTGGEVYVMSNRGNNSPTTDTSKNHNSTNSYIRIRNSSGTWSTLDTAIDISGRITTGGNDFQAYKRFSNTVTRVATKVVNPTSSLDNKKFTKLVPRIKKVGVLTGNITATIRDVNDVVKVQFSSVDVSSIPANGAYNDVEFTNVTHNYFTNSGPLDGDKISFEYNGSDSGVNYLELNANKDIIDTLNTITQHYNGNYVDDAQHDLAGKYYTGGEPDLTSRTRIAQSIEHQSSRLKGKKITRVTAYMYRINTSVTGNVYCNIRRGSDDALIKTLQFHPVSTFNANPAVPTTVVFTDTSNSYALGVGDKISIEYTGITSTDQIGILVRTVTPDYDTVNNINASYIRKYDEIDWDDELPTKDLCGIMEEGGFMYTPAAGEQPDPTPINDKDLIIMAGNNKLSGFTEALISEFRIYTKELTLTQANNLHSNRYSISSIQKGKILMPFTFRLVP